MSFSLTKLLVGRPIANREAEGRKLNVLTGLPAMGLDGIASAAYGPEAALTILAATGAAGLAHIGPITWAILLLLAILCCSYWQTIEAYPNNGGSYVVAKDNLGINAGLLAAAALMVDYLLNVAVGISAGVGALTSAIPTLHPYTLWLCIGILAAITTMNLRGTRETGMAWAVPTYLFVASLGLVLAWGAYKVVSAGGHPSAVVRPPDIQQATGAVTLWLLLRAFASGCTAMTGVEAVSNGVSAFREPKVRHAHGTLVAIVVILGLLLLGIAHVAQAYGVMAMDQSKPGYQSVLSQLVGAICGRGWFYYVTIGSVLAVLCLSANTSYVDFPRLCHLVAEDGFLPSPFSHSWAGGLFTRLASCFRCWRRRLARRVRRRHGPAHSPFRSRCFPFVYHLADRHGGALVAARQAPRRPIEARSSTAWAQSPPESPWRSSLRRSS